MGTELLLGDILNTNAQFIARELAALGISVYNQQVVGDNPARLEQAAKLARFRSDIVIYTGGLGPTDDDLTKQTVAKVYNDTLVFNGEVCDEIENYFRNLGRPMPENNRKQAYVPSRGRYLKNEYGTAPGIVFVDGEKMAILMPGVPREMIPMMQNQVIPMLAKLAKGVIKSRFVGVIGIGESALEEKIKYLLDSENPTMALYAKEGEVTVRITANAPDNRTAEDMLIKAYNRLSQAVGDCIYGVDVENIETAIVHRLSFENKKVAVAESCTGGKIASRITSVPGASRVFTRGVCAYTEEEKEKILSVPAEDIEMYSAVSAQVAGRMATGIMELTGADYAVATTGYRGPSGGTPQDPVGTVYIAVADRENIYIKKCFFVGERRRVTHLACQSALDMLRRVIENLPIEEVRVEENTARITDEKVVKPRVSFFKKFLTVVALVLIAVVLAFGYLWFKNDGSINLPFLSFDGILSQLGLGAKTPEEMVEKRKDEDFYAVSFESDTLDMLEKLQKSDETLEGWLTFKNSKSEYPIYNRQQDDKIRFLPDGVLEDYVYVSGFDTENFFDMTSLEQVRDNASFVLFDQGKYKNYQIFSVGTFSQEDLSRLSSTESKQDYIVNARARSLYDVDAMVTEKTPVTSLVQQVGDGEYIIAFAVESDRTHIPSVDVKTMNLYADWYMDENGLTDEGAADAILYAQELYDRDTWSLASPNLSEAYSEQNFRSTPQGTESGSKNSQALSGSSVSNGRSSSSKGSQSSGSQSSQSSRPESRGNTNSRTSRSSSAEPAPGQGEEILTVRMNGQVVSGPASEILSQIVAVEMTATWNSEALKAQAIATHTYLEYEYARGVTAPSVNGRSSPAASVKNAVSQVSDLIMTVGGAPINAVYTASAAGRTNPSSQVWGTNYSYLQSVESKYDYSSPGYEHTYTFSLGDMKNILESAIGVTLDENDAANWFQVVDYTDGGYIRRLKIGDATEYVARNGNTRNITGYWFATEIMADAGHPLRSAAFDVTYRDGVFTFVTRGYGHGAGMSQWGAQLYAQNEGWNYSQILTHYYTGVTIGKK